MGEGENSGEATAGDRVRLNVGGKVFETTAATVRAGGPESLLFALANHGGNDPVFIDREPEVFAVLLSLLRSNRLPSAAKGVSRQELVEEAIYFGIDSLVRSALAPSRLNGVDASLFSTIRPSFDGIVSDFDADDSDGSLLLAHGGQISVYDWNLGRMGTLRTHLDCITSVRRIRPGIAAIGSVLGSGLHLYDTASGGRILST